MSDAGRGRLRRVFRLPASRARIRQDVDEELRFHIDGRVEDLIARGFNRAEAEAEARRRFGDYAAYLGEASTIDEHIVQEQRRMDFVDTVIRETRQAARVLARSRGFTVTAVLTLALSLGAATAIFTLLDAVVLRPLPYRNAERLVHLSSPVPKFEGDTLWGLARHEVYYFLEHSRTLENLGVFRSDQITVMGEQDGRPAERARSAIVTASLLETLGFRTVAGRLFTLDDNLPDRIRIVILSHDYWRARFGGDRGIVGRTIDLSGNPYTVVGIMEPGAQLPDRQVDLWMPAPAHPSMAAQNNHSWQGIGLLREGYTADDAERDLAPLTARLSEVFPNAEPREFMEATGFRTQVLPLRDVVVGHVMTRAIWILFGAVLLVLVIAAANLSNLFMVRYDARRRETAVRAALGAENVHFAVQFIAESMLIAIAAAALAVLLAQLGLR
ncbi:MAG: ABC transporter permease, partial [Gemmatimonadota bacterium]|nr:ABC transporter permease [Gemmatimonadota bacterium]